MGSHVLHTCNDPPCHVPQRSAHACTCNDPPCTAFPFLCIFLPIPKWVSSHTMLPCMPSLYLSTGQCPVSILLLELLCLLVGSSVRIFSSVHPSSILSSPCVVGFPRRWEGLVRAREIQAQSKQSPPPPLAHRSATTID